MRLVIAVVATVVVGQSCATKRNDSNEVSAVRASFAAYKEAMVAKNGERAASLVDGHTADYYASLAKLAMTASRAELSPRRIVDKLLILQLRQFFSAEQLSEMSGRQLLARMVSSGWLGSALHAVRLGAISIDGDVAHAKPKVRSTELTSSVTFRKFRGEWKIDLTTLVAFADSAYQPMLASLSADEDEAILKFMALTAELRGASKPDERLWEPLIK